MTDPTNDGDPRNWLEIELKDDPDKALEQAIDAARAPPGLRGRLGTRCEGAARRSTCFGELLRRRSGRVRLPDGCATGG